MRKNFIKIEKDVVNSVIQTMRIYSAFPAVTGTKDEITFLKFVKRDFEDPSKYDTREVRKNNQLEYVFFRSRSSTSFTKKYFFVVHVDRVPGGLQGAYTNTIKEDDQVIEGQLDNIISLAMLKILHQNHIPFNVLFTTKEEWVGSTHQLFDIVKNFNLQPITIDIDVFNNLEEFKNGEITLRFKDNVYKFDEELVKRMQTLARNLKIPFLVEEGFAIVESGQLGRYTEGENLGAHIGIPIINYHTDHEKTLKEVVNNAVKFITNFLIQNKGENNGSNYLC